MWSKHPYREKHSIEWPDSPGPTWVCLRAELMASWQAESPTKVTCSLCLLGNRSQPSFPSSRCPSYSGLGFFVVVGGFVGQNWLNIFAFCTFAEGSCEVHFRFAQQALPFSSYMHEKCLVRTCKNEFKSLGPEAGNPSQVPGLRTALLAADVDQLWLGPPQSLRAGALVMSPLHWHFFPGGVRTVNATAKVTVAQSSGFFKYQPWTTRSSYKTHFWVVWRLPYIPRLSMAKLRI